MGTSRLSILGMSFILKMLGLGFILKTTGLYYILKKLGVAFYFEKVRIVLYFENFRTTFYFGNSLLPWINSGAMRSRSRVSSRSFDPLHSFQPEGRRCSLIHISGII